MAFTVISTSILDTSSEKSKSMISAFCAYVLPIFYLRHRFLRLVAKVVYIQNKIRAQLKTKLCKAEVIETYWNKLYGQVMTKAIKFNDQKTKDLLFGITRIPASVKK